MLNATTKQELEELARDALRGASERLTQLLGKSPNLATVAVFAESDGENVVFLSTTRAALLNMLEVDIGDTTAKLVAAGLRKKTARGEVPVVFVGRMRGETVVQSASAFYGVSEGGEA